ncbi:iron-containing redox enzyme family protein [Nostoc sp.]|uniref:iron-containing redox enzyme family protein n=1 Tax=Nostoc sp. TaxID=1180 RepID=UPI002FF72074
MTSLTGKETKSNAQILEQLSSHDLNQKLKNHEVLNKIRQDFLNEEQVSFILSQYWHPLDNFPSFLAGLIFCTKSVEIQTFVSKILYQELGEGNFQKAHSVVYKKTIYDVGLDLEKIINTPPLPETTSLVEIYNLLLNNLNYLRALGGLYSTEFYDLKIVSSIGKAISNHTKSQKLHWVDIHVTQEPDHVASVEYALSCQFDSEQENEILQGAKEMFSGWINFFDAIGNHL